jgi:hypothetical protein
MPFIIEIYHIKGHQNKYKLTDEESLNVEADELAHIAHSRLTSRPMLNSQPTWLNSNSTIDISIPTIQEW